MTHLLSLSIYSIPHHGPYTDDARCTLIELLSKRKEEKNKENHMREERREKHVSQRAQEEEDTNDWSSNWSGDLDPSYTRVGRVFCLILVL